MKPLNEYIYEQLDESNGLKAFIIVKPGFLDHVDEIIEYAIRKGFILHKKTKPMTISLEDAKELYKSLKDKEYYKDLCEYMSSGKIVAASFGFDHDKYPGVNSIACMKDIKQHFRDKYAKDDMKNCMHSSDSLNNVQREAKLIIK